MELEDGSCKRGADMSYATSFIPSGDQRHGLWRLRRTSVEWMEITRKQEPTWAEDTESLVSASDLLWQVRAFLEEGMGSDWMGLEALILLMPLQSCVHRCWRLHQSPEKSVL